jgi:hypothetical protein
MCIYLYTIQFSIFYIREYFLRGLGTIDSTMDKMVMGDFESQNSNDGGANGSSLVAMTIAHPMVRDLAYLASNKAQNRVFKQTAAFNAGSGRVQKAEDTTNKCIIALMLLCGLLR